MNDKTTKKQELLKMSYLKNVTVLLKIVSLSIFCYLNVLFLEI